MVGKGDEDEMKKEKPTKHQKECPICMSKKDMPDEFWSNEPDIYADLISPIGSFRNRIPNPSPELSFNIMGKRFRYRFTKELPSLSGAYHSLYHFDNKQVHEKTARLLQYNLNSIE